MIGDICSICGCDLSTNPHPHAGEPAHLNTIGAKVECLPCACKRANGRAEVLANFREWLEDCRRLAMQVPAPICAMVYEAAIAELKELEEARKREYHKSSATA